MHSQKLKSFFGSLASVSRLSILFSLVSGEKTVNRLARSLDLEQSIVSHGLRRLSAHGLILVRKEGRERWYRLNEEKTHHVMALVNMLDPQTPRLSGGANPDYVVILEKGGHFTYFRNFTGAKISMDVVGKSVYEFIPSFFKTVAKRKIEKMFKTDKSFHWKLPALDDKGVLRWYSANIEPVDGRTDVKVISATMVK